MGHRRLPPSVGGAGGGFKLCCMEPWVSRERETAGVGGWQEVVDVGA